MTLQGTFLQVAALSMLAFCAHAAEQPPGFWTTPTIEGYGKIHYVADSAYKPQPNQIYKIVFSVTQTSKSPSEVNASLDHVARTVNLYVAAGVPLRQLKFVAIVSGPATPLILNDEQYRAAYGISNPNIPLIEKLRNAGIDVAVCAQAVGEHGFQPAWVDRHVTLALSGLTTVTTLEHQGYDLLPL